MYLLNFFISITSTSGYTHWKTNWSPTKFSPLTSCSWKTFWYKNLHPLHWWRRWISHAWLISSFDLHSTPCFSIIDASTGCHSRKMTSSPSWDNQNTFTSSCLTIQFWFVACHHPHISSTIYPPEPLKKGHHLKFFLMTNQFMHIFVFFSSLCYLWLRPCAQN